MMHLMLLLPAVVAAGPLKIDGANVPGSDLVKVGSVELREASVIVNGGRVEFNAARQKALSAQLARSGTVIISLIDQSSDDTTALTLGAMSLVRTLDIWYLVNPTGGVWRQISLAPTKPGAALKLALIEDGKQVHVIANGKDCGLTPYDAKAPQNFAFGSAGNVKIPWKGELRDFDVTSQTLTTDDLTRRFGSDTAVVTPPGNTPPVSTPPISTPPVTTPTTPPVTTPTPGSQPVSNEAITKSTVVVVDLTDFTQDPEPNEILPYHDAIVTHEYKVVEVKSGHLDKVAVGTIIRVARWGVLGGKKTDVAKLNKGDRVQLTLEKYSDHPDLEHQFTRDTLPDNFAAPYLLDMTGRSSG